MKSETKKYKAILVDFDGVLRKWPDSDSTVEKKYGMKEKSISETAFGQALLNQAILGMITDEEWRSKIAASLKVEHPNSDVQTAIKEWSYSSGEIDAEMLNVLSCCKPETEILLLTNATSRLEDDLAALGLDNWFKEVVNSSEVGSIKPEPEIFRMAIKLCNCHVDEIVYIDDSEKNTLAATEAGILSHHFTGLAGCKQFLSKVGLPRGSNKNGI